MVDLMIKLEKLEVDHPVLSAMIDIACIAIFAFAFLYLAAN